MTIYGNLLSSQKRRGFVGIRDKSRGERAKEGENGGKWAMDGWGRWGKMGETEIIKG